ncbi:DUF4249 domain-containing protein [bacterium SCSIO 12741]|nr:DUF4249 domain-containing protein [bacterium SCSIO 12741]
MKNWIYPIALLALVSSCRPKPIDIDVPQAESKLVVSSISVPDRILVINVSRSFTALEQSPVGEGGDTALLNQLFVSGCQVFLSNGNESQRLLDLGNGMYAGTEVTRVVDKEYELTVYDPKKDQQVSSKTLVPPQVSLNNVTAQKRYRYERFEIVVDFTFTNTSGGSHYLVNCYANSDEGATYENFALTYGRSESTLIEHSAFGEPYNGSIVLSDWDNDTILVSLSEITSEYYDYLQARDRASTSVPFLSEPVSLPTNVEGGYGFFTAHFPDARAVEVKPQ